MPFSAPSGRTISNETRSQNTMFNRTIRKKTNPLTLALLFSGSRSVNTTDSALAANAAYADSGADAALSLVGLTSTACAETGDFYTLLARLSGTSDGYMDEAHGLHNTLRADLVVLVSEDTTYCGLAYLMGNPSVSFAGSAFAVVKPACFSNQTLAHEIGHLQGNDHDRLNGTGHRDAGSFRRGGDLGGRGDGDRGRSHAGDAEHAQGDLVGDRLRAGGGYHAARAGAVGRDLSLSGPCREFGRRFKLGDCRVQQRWNGRQFHHRFRYRTQASLTPSVGRRCRLCIVAQRARLSCRHCPSPLPRPWPNRSTTWPTS